MMAQFTELLTHLPHKLNIFGPRCPDLDWPALSRYQPDLHNDGFGHMSLTKIHPDTTIVEEFYADEARIFFIKLYRLNVYPLPRFFVGPYENVKHCEVRYFIADISKLFHFLSELSSLKKLIIDHAAIYGGQDQDQLAPTVPVPMFSRLRTCPSLKRVDLMVDARFAVKLQKRKRAVLGNGFRRLPSIYWMSLPIWPWQSSLYQTTSTSALCTTDFVFSSNNHDNPLPDLRDLPQHQPVLLPILLVILTATERHSHRSANGKSRPSNGETVTLEDDGDDDHDVIFLQSIQNERLPQPTTSEDVNSRGNGHGQPRHYYGERY